MFFNIYSFKGDFWRDREKGQCNRPDHKPLEIQKCDPTSPTASYRFWLYLWSSFALNSKPSPVLRCRSSPSTVIIQYMQHPLNYVMQGFNTVKLKHFTCD